MGLRFASEQCDTRPLTRSQLLIWTGQRLQPDDPLYNMAIAFSLHGAIDADVFQLAFQQVVQASDAMRTTFEHHAGVARQRFHEQYLYDVERIDLSQERDPRGALENWFRERTTVRFDLERCLFDSVLVRLAENDYVWYFNQHHLVTDATSTALIYRAVANEYRRLKDDTGDDPVSFSSYGDYVDYEESRQSTKSRQRAEQYWEARTADRIAPVSFYSEVPAEHSGVTLRVPCKLGVSRIERIRALAGSAHCRAMTADLAQFQVFATTLFAWLFRVTGNHTLAIGTPTHNRGSTSHKNTPGLFIELYPLIVTVDEQDTFTDLYRKVSKSVQELLVYSGPGVTSFALNRDVQVVLNYITAEFGPFGDIPATSEWLHPDSGDRSHLVRVQVENFDGLDKLRVFFDVNDSAFPGAQRSMPGNHFRALMDAFTEDPESRIAAVDLLDEQAAETLAKGTPALDSSDYSLDSVIESFRRQAEATPDAVALAHEQHSMTYRVLLNEASAFARQLISESPGKRFGAGDRVAIMLPRSFEAVVAMLGTLISGGAYVPIDTDYPQARRDFILNDGDVSAVVRRESDRDPLPDGILELSVTLGQELPAPAEPGPNPEPGQAAYVIYTSGSTGRPKGVEVSHGALANYIGWARSYYQPDGALTWPLFSSMAFDLTVTSLFVPLCSGGKLVVYTGSDDRHEIVVRRVVEDNRVDIIKLTPAHLALLQAMDLSTSRLQSLIVGGEDFRTELARSVHNYFGGRVRLFNEYGPTEGTVACSVHCFDSDSDTAASVPIGRSISNTCLYVLNGARKLQPPGVAGELYIGGAGVATGYVNNPGLTAERFVDNPFRPGETMYRTGDLVRLRLDHQGEPEVLMCLGRIDNQIKVNGLRTEPAEIEQALLRHPAVTEALACLYVPEQPTDDADEAFCARCGISGRHPSAQLDDSHICRICHIYAAESERAQAYFGTGDDLQPIVNTIVASRDSRPEGAADCMMLLSGGKDSTYALCQIVDLGLRPLVFTLDNGFISQGAKDNMARVVEHLGLELIVGSTSAMNEIFRDSLNRFSNVCNGCFKTIYTLSMQIARERGIRHIFTGLSRGQIFETRVADLFRQGEFDIERIDTMIVEARKAYHHADDAVSRLLDVSHFDDDAIFDDIEYVDYYRYSEVSLDAILDYLKTRVPWVRPADTGRSTNCLINEAGIYVHQKERGFHNYSLPYSWDVRLGHKERDAAREELDDNINVDNVKRILDEIGYTPRSNTADTRRRAILVAYYVASKTVDSAELRERLAEVLPEGLIPSAFVQLDAMPLTRNGKIDRDALPPPGASRSHLAVNYEAPGGQVETVLTEAWQHVFGIDRIGVNDNFFELGGDSIVNIQIVATVARHGLLISPQQIFDSPTIRELAAVAQTGGELTSEQGPVSGPVPLSPAQLRFFSWSLKEPNRYCQFVALDAGQAIDAYALEETLRQLVTHHDALRARFEQTGEGWQQTFDKPGAVDRLLDRVSQTSGGGIKLSDQITTLVQSAQDEFELERGQLFRAILLEGAGENPVLILIAHHLVVDAVSWWILLEDLEDGYRALSAGKPVALPPKTTSMRRWSELNIEFARSVVARTELPVWQKAVAGVKELPVETATSVDGSTAHAAVVRTHDFHLDRASSRALLTEVSANWRVQPQDLILTAFVETVMDWSRLSSVTVDIEAHGREPISRELDILRTVGWFTSVYPLSFERTDDNSDDAGMLRAVRDTLRKVQLGGVSYGAMRYLSEREEVARSLEPAIPVPIVFNYLGVWRKRQQKDALFGFARPLDASYGGGNSRPYAWELNAMFFDGELRVQWDCAANSASEKTITELMKRMRQRLRALIGFCLENEDTRFTPQDFPNAGIAQDDLDDLMAEYGDL